jgi:hypothetical protein
MLQPPLVSSIEDELRAEH